MKLAARNRATIQPLGVVYTPAAVCRAMAELALAPLLDGRDIDGVLALRVCDPAIGEGAFLVEVIEVMAQRIAALGGEVEDARRHVAAQCVYGVDIDARAVATVCALGIPNVHVADALEHAWPVTFDLAIGNPPYIRQELLGAKHALKAFASYAGEADLYVYFIELAHRIARRWCFITPNKWLTVAYGRPLRQFLAERRSVEGVIDLARAPVFDADAFPCIVWGTSDGASGLVAARSASVDALAGEPHDRTRWTAGPWHIDVSRDRALIDALEQKWPPLGTLVERPMRGIVSGLNRVFEISGETRARLVAADARSAEIIRPLVKGRDIRPYRAEREDRHVLLVDRGTPIERYPAVLQYLAQFRDELEPKRDRDAPRGRKPGAYRWYELQDPVGPLAASRAPRLFYQDIQTAPACCLDETGLIPDTTVWVLPTADRYLLAVLNSPLYGWYAQRRFPPALNGAVRPKHEYMRTLPIAQPSPQQRAAVEELVAARLAGAPVDDAIADTVLAVYGVTRDQLSGS